MSKEEEDKMRFHWDAVIRAFVCERCGTIKISSANMIKHVLEHIKDEEGGGDGHRGQDR